LEENAALLYNNLSERVETPLTKSLLLSISKDSSKHSIFLKGIADSISDSKQKPKDCAKKLGEVWNIATNSLNEVDKKERMVN
jgi:rubrerythrin